VIPGVVANSRWAVASPTNDDNTLLVIEEEEPCTTTEVMDTYLHTQREENKRDWFKL